MGKLISKKERQRRQKRDEKKRKKEKGSLKPETNENRRTFNWEHKG